MEFENSAEIGTVYMGEAVVGSSESDGQSWDKGGMVSKHTPGPWEIEEFGSYGPSVICSDRTNPDYGTAAHDVGHETHCIATPHGPNRKVNARLIAAAPSLLAALEAALYHEAHEEGRCGCCWTDKAEKAIAKVKEVQG